MGCRIRAVSDDEGGAVSNGSMSEALLFTTMCIIGLPVEVHVKDGSVYSGIFHTACVENDYGVVLKKARMIKKGKNDANVANGAMIETLVVLSGDLVQVVAKGVFLPSDGAVGNAAGDSVEPVACTIEKDTKTTKSKKFALNRKKFDQTRSSAQNGNVFDHVHTRAFHENNFPKKVEKALQEGNMVPSFSGHGINIESKKRDGIHATKSEEISSLPVNGRQSRDDAPQSDHDDYKEKFEFHEKETPHEVLSPRSSLDECATQVKRPEEVHAKMTSKTLTDGGSRHHPAPSVVKPDNRCCERPTSASAPSSDAISSGVSTSFSSVVNATSESGLSSLAAQSGMIYPQSLISNKSAKEFKLNPEAKVFSPSFVNPRSASPPTTSTVASMTYIPNNTPVVQVASAQPEIAISPFAAQPSLPAKFVPYSNLTTGNAGNGSQYSQPVVGQVGSRTQAVRFAGQYHPVQAGPTYVHPNSQAVMVGRSGQLFYVHPVTHDAVHGAAAISPTPARPILTPHQFQFPKHQGTQAAQALQIYVPPHFVAGGQQSIVVPSQIPLLQPPFIANRPIPIPGSNGFYSTKFP